MNTGYRKRVVAILFVLLLGRFWFSQTFELTGPEAYAWMKSRHLDWGYWDQGPLVPFVIWLGTLFYGSTELGVRWIGANIYACVGFLVFLLARSWFNARTGFYAVLIYAVLPLYAWSMLLLSEASLGVGFMALTLMACWRILQTNHWAWWAAAGLAMAAATTLSWWNLLWLPGFLFFLATDPRRTTRLFHAQSIAMSVLAVSGLFPYLLWHWQVSDVGMSWEVLGRLLDPQQYPTSAGWGFAWLIDFGVWFGGGLFFLALGCALYFYRSYTHLLREHHFFLFVSLPGIFMQMILGCLGRANQDVWPALILPWVIVVASVGARLSDLGRVWRVSAMTLLIGIGLVTLTGFWPSTAKSWWSHYAPNPGLEASHLAAEAARWRREAGAAFFIASTPEQASLLSFYLPLQPMIYLPAGEGVRHQFDLWNSYYDFQGVNALYVTPTETPLPSQLAREFEEVKKLEEPQATGQQWLFYSCQRFGASR